MLECPTHGTSLLINYNRRTLRLLYLANQPSYEYRSFDGGCQELAIVAVFILGMVGIECINRLLPQQWPSRRRLRGVVEVFAP